MKRLVSILLLLSLLMTLPAAVAEGEYSRVKSILLAQLGHPDVEQSGAAASLVLAIDMTDSTVMLLGNSGPDSEQCLWTDVESALQQSLLKSFLTDYAAYQSAPGGFSIALKQNPGDSFAYICDAATAAQVLGRMQ